MLMNLLSSCICMKYFTCSNEQSIPLLKILSENTMLQPRCLQIPKIWWRIIIMGIFILLLLPVHNIYVCLSSGDVCFSSRPFASPPQKLVVQLLLLHFKGNSFKLFILIYHRMENHILNLMKYLDQTIFECLIVVFEGAGETLCFYVKINF